MIVKEEIGALWLIVGLLGGAFVVYIVMNEMRTAGGSMLDITRDDSGRITGVLEKNI